MSDAKPVSRPMRFPYTMSAKIAQFPYKYYWNNSWLFRYHLMAMVVCIPVFYKIQKASYSPENVKKWEEVRRRDFTPGGHH